MRCLVVRQDEGCAVLFSLTNKTHKLNFEPRNRHNSRIYIPSFHRHLLSLFLPYYTHEHYPDLNTTRLAQNIASRFKTHPITYTTLYVHSELPFATFDCIIMLMPWIQIHFQLAAMAPKGSHKEKGKATARAKMPTSVINRRLSLDRDCIKGFISQHIRGVIRIYNDCSVKNERGWDLIYDLIFLDPVTTRHFSQFQLMWPHHRSRSSPFREWWAACRLCIGQMFDKTRDQINNWRWENPRVFGDQVDRSNPQATSSQKVKRTGERFSWYCSDDLMAKIEPPSCRQYKPGNFLAVRPLHWEHIIDKDDDDEKWADPGAPSGGRSPHGDAIDNHDGEGEEDMQGGEKGTGKGKGTQDGKGEGKGNGTGNGKGKGIVKLYEAGSDTEG